MKSLLVIFLFFVYICRPLFSNEEISEKVRSLVRNSLDELYKNQNYPDLDGYLFNVKKGKKDAEEIILAYLVILKEDEESGPAPWTSTPYWESEKINPAMELREKVLASLIKESIKSLK